MSIHTILSQEIVSDKTNRIYVRSKKYPNGGLIMGEEVDKFLKHLAIRIVEEAKREERERIVKLKKKYKTFRFVNQKWVGGRPYDRHQQIAFYKGYKQGIKDAIGTKLQKMKDGDKHE